MLFPKPITHVIGPPGREVLPTAVPLGHGVVGEGEYRAGHGTKSRSYGSRSNVGLGAKEVEVETQYATYFSPSASPLG